MEKSKTRTEEKSESKKGIFVHDLISNSFGTELEIIITVIHHKHFKI